MFVTGHEIQDATMPTTNTKPAARFLSVTQECQYMHCELLSQWYMVQDASTGDMPTEPNTWAVSNGTKECLSVTCR